MIHSFTTGKLFYSYTFLLNSLVTVSFLLLGSGSQLVAQEFYGISVSNFGGINAVHLNPSSSANSKVYLDANLATFGFSVANNFVFIHKEDYKLRNMIMRNPEFPSAENRGEGVDYTTNNDHIDAYTRNDLIGPAFSLSVGKHSFGFFSRGVVANSVTRLPVDIGVFIFEGLDYEPIQNTEITGNDFDMGAVGWAELGLNYALMFKEDRLNYWSAGINFRRLIGHSGAYLDAQNVDFTVGADQSLDIRTLSAGIGYALPLDYNTNEYPGPDPLFKGSGTATDIGMTYRRNLEENVQSDPAKYCQYNYQPYLYKIGLSLLDLGSITFDHQAQEHFFDDVSAYWQNVDTTGFTSLTEFTRQLSTVFYGDPDASLAEVDNMKINLSTAVSLQADYQYYPDWYLSGVLVLPIRMGDYQVARPGHAYLGVRYETDLYEVNLPVSLYDFNKPRIGLYGRYSYFSFGTENLASLLGLNDLYALDFYFSVKFHLQKGYCNRFKPWKDCSNIAF